MTCTTHGGIAKTARPTRLREMRSSTAKSRLPVILWMTLLGLVGSWPGAAHVVMGTKSLHLRVAESDLVVRARVLAPELLFTSKDGRTRRPLVEIEILEPIKGEAEAKRLRFVQGGHEATRFEKGEEALFFLDPIEKSRELRSLAGAGGPTHVSRQEHDEPFRIEPPHGDVLLGAVRAFARSESATAIDERISLIRGATLDLLLSGDPDLGQAALASLVLSPNAELLTAQDLPRLERFLADPKISVGLRAGILNELDRRGYVQGAARWVSLLETAPPDQQTAAIRAAGRHPSEEVTRALLSRLARRETPAEIEVAAEAAIALGASQRPEVVEALAGALGHSSARLRSAAIRALGQIGSAPARAALETTAAQHSNEATRKRAGAEVRVLDKRSARSRVR